MVEVRLVVEVKDEKGRVGRKYLGCVAPRIDEAITAFLDLAFYSSATFVRDTLSDEGLKTLEYDDSPKKEAAPPKKKAAASKVKAASAASPPARKKNGRSTSKSK